MRPTGNMRDGPGPTAFNSMLASTYEADRDRGEARRHEHERARVRAKDGRLLTQARLLAVVRAPLKPVVALRARLKREHSFTDYPCRLPDGRLGRVAVVRDRNDWTMVCRVA